MFIFVNLENMDNEYLVMKFINGIESVIVYYVIKSIVIYYVIGSSVVYGVKIIY